ncbi:MAG TPA: Ig-like domain-containing protein, partial [Longimicrobiaceae bacterium]
TTGTYAFQYRLANAAGTDDATVTITVRKAPDAKDDAFNMLQGATLNGDLTANNGSGADDLGFPAATVASFGGGSLGGTSTSNAAGTGVSLAGGTLTVNANGTFSLANPTTAGTYTFRYLLTNAAGSDSATVTIQVQRPPDAKDDAFTTQTATTLNGNVTSDNGSGADDLGDPAGTVTGFGGGSLAGNTTTNAAGASATFAGGTLTVNANGTFSLVNPTTGGVFTFRYRLTNPAGVDSATVTVTVNAPPTAVADTPSTNSAPGSAFHTALNTTLSTPSLLANDNLGFPAATLTSFGGGTPGGTVTTNAAGSTLTFDGHSLTVNSNGSFTYTPKNNFTGLFTFQYRITNAAGTSDATVTIAVGIRPSASGSTYTPTLVGNVPINTATNTNFQVTAAGDQATYNVTAHTGGTAVVGSDKTFTFTPDAGFTGAASFSFTVTNGFGTSSAATVSLTVGPSLVWFVDASAGAGGDGRRGTPFNCLVGASGCYNGSANLAGQIIYLASGTYSGTGTVTLKNTQRVIGQGATGTFNTLAGIATWPADAGAQPSTGGTSPVVSPTAGAAITLASGNTVRGLRANPAAGAGITGSSVGTLTLTELAIHATGGPALDLASGTASVTVDSLQSTNSSGTGINLSSVAGTVTINGSTSAITNPAGAAVSISGSNPTFTFPGTISKTNGSNPGISLSGMTGGSATFSGPSVVLSTGSSAGISMTTSTATLSFVDSVKVTTSTGNGINATSGTLTIAGTHNSITSAGGIALNVSGATIGAGGLNFRSISATGGANGIVLSNTGSNGLTVTGNGTAGSGGTIQNAVGADGATAGNGVYLSGARNVSLSWMTLSNHQNNGIFGTGVRGALTLDHLTLNGNQGNSNVGGSTEESAIHLVDVGGAVKITNSSISGGAYDNVRIRNDAGTSPTVDSLVFASNTLGTMQGSAVDARNHAVAMTFADGTADVRIRKNDVNFWWGTGIDVVFQGTASSTNVAVTGNNVSQGNATPAPGASGIVVDGGNIKFDISSDTVMFATGAAIAVDEASNLASTFHGTISNNVIGASGVTNSGSSQGSAVSVIHLGAGTTTVNVTNNVIRQINGIQAILLQGGDASASGGDGTFNTTVTGNDIQEAGSTLNSGRSAIILTAGTASGDGHQFCADLGGSGGLKNNIVNFNTASAGNENRIRPNQRFETTVNMPGYTGANNDNAAVATYLLGRNTATQVVASNSVATGGGGYVNTASGAACPQP